MPYVPIAVNRDTLTILDVPFPDLKTLESTAAAIGSNMFEGFQPTRRGIEIIRDYCLGEMTFAQLIDAAREKIYEE
ncbi:MAG: antitoxin VbhA family protein [Synergistaceae bacterium]|nr:antitoxin VbhA family protein [Synergistaceae bacterium]